MPKSAPTLPLFIDSDNALGSVFGDVDDAFALAALIRSGVPVTAIAATHGNTSERRAFNNHRALAGVMGYGGPILRGSEVAAFLARSGEVRILALGPLTNVADALRQGASPQEIVVVGGNQSSAGRWPPWWPHEFNLTMDRPAAREVFDSAVPLTIFPLDVTRQLDATGSDLETLAGERGAFLRRGARRWMWRLRLLKASGRFPVYDLAAALYAIDPDGFRLEQTVASMRASTYLTFGAGTRPVTVCRGFDRSALWDRFRRLLES